jgi:hypothetical protein
LEGNRKKKKMRFRILTLLFLLLHAVHPFKITPNTKRTILKPPQQHKSRSFSSNQPKSIPSLTPSFPIAALLPLFSLLPPTTSAAVSVPLSTGQFDPNNFKPVCSASDGFYRALQGATQGVIGPENYVEYGPLIAGGLLRVRLELCVVESFFNEAVLPFVRQNGLSWVLPLHETVEVR